MPDSRLMNTIVLNMRYESAILPAMMVLDLSRSEARRRLLSLFFADPTREYHLRDLARLIDMSIGAVQNVVGKLGREGLLKRRALGNLALFSLNQQHPLYGELEAVVTKTIGIAPQLARALAETNGVRLAFIYGSYVSVFSKSGSAWTAESDVDLLVVGDADPRAISSIARDLGKLTNRQINYTVLAAQELLEKIAKRDSFIGEVLSKPILPLAGFPNSETTTPIRSKPKDLLKILERPA
jgi:predicted nucleotidyltransferase